MAAALQVLGGKQGRRIAVLGDMLELGDRASAAHQQVGRIAAHKADILLAYGPNSAETIAGAVADGMEAANAIAFTDRQRLVEQLKSVAMPGDVLLFKGSRGMRMELALEGFLKET